MATASRGRQDISPPFLRYCCFNVCSVPGTVLRSGDSDVTDAPFAASGTFYAPSQALAIQLFGSYVGSLTSAAQGVSHFLQGFWVVYATPGACLAIWPLANI